jgi:hypothetical protein
MKRPRARTACALVAAAGTGLAACMPSTAPGWMFWSAVALSCAAAAGWGWLDQRDG